MQSRGKAILVCLLIAVTFAFFSLKNKPRLKYAVYSGLPFSDYHQINTPAIGRHITIELEPDNIQRITAVDIVIDGKAQFHLDNKPVSPVCGNIDSRQRCRIVLHHGKTKRYIYIDAVDREIRISALDFIVLKESRLTAASYIDLFLVWIGMLLFIPLIWATYKNKAINQWALVLFSASIIFYIQPLFSIVLAIYLISSHYIGTRFSQRHDKLLWLVFIASLFILIFFKYIGDDLLGLFLDPGDFGLILPVGLSYFIIRAVDTQVNWYRGLQRDVSIREYLCYIMFPATLPAGPIDTLDHFRNARKEKIGSNDVLYGVSRILLGLFKKIVIADYLLFRPIFGGNGLFVKVMSTAAVEPGVEIIILLAGSFLFVYFDFSAYSDIAIGIGRCIGYQVPENFNLPVIASSIRDFWKRWHISLSNWCMRNIYFPLLITTRNTILPAYMVMIAVGMWHSFTTSWFLWAMHHGSAIAFQGSIEGRFKRAKIRKGMHPIIWRLFFIGVVFIWVSAGHAFAQVHDPFVALDLYRAYWASFLNLLLKK